MLLKKRSDLLSFFSLLLVIGLVLWVLFGPIIRNPDNFLFGEGDDAIKNYFTYIYYTLFDKGTHFSGMNYPFGEHVVFTDSQPFFSLITNLVNKIYPLTGLQVIGVINMLMLAGIFTGAVFIYLILRKNLIPGWFAIIATGCITFLNPQLMRIKNHYALSYMFVVPITWYLLIRIFESRKKVHWYVIYVLFSLITGFIHPYHLTISAILTLAYTFVFLLQELGNFRAIWRFLVKLVVMAIAPVVLFQIIMKLTDPIADRPKTPWGFLIYRTSFESVFFPNEEPLLGFWRDVFKTSEPIWEGYAYVGLMGLICLILSCILVIRYLRRARFRAIFRPALPLPLRIGIWAATLTLLFSMGIPFTFGLEGLLEYLPPLKQFRSIGRFAWIFYYIYSVYVAFYFYRLYRYLSLKQASGFGASLLVIIFLVWGLDAKINAERKAREIKRQDSARQFMGNSGNYTEALALARRNPTEFQAILPLPFFLIGSEYFGFYPTTASGYETMKASLNLKLPIATGMLSRTSYSNSMQLTQLLSHELIPKEILTHYPNKKPLLLIVTPGTLKPHEERLLSRGRLVTTLGQHKLYELPLAAFQTPLKPIIQQFETEKPAYIQKNGAFTKTGNADVVIKNFDNQNSGGFLTDAGISLKGTGNLNLYNETIPNAQDSTIYEVSVWWKLNPDVPVSVLHLRRYSQNGTLLEEKTQPFREPTDIFRNWAKATLEIKIDNPTERLEVLLETENGRANHLLIRPKNVDVYQYTLGNKHLLLNNYLLK